MARYACASYSNGFLPQLSARGDDDVTAMSVFTDIVSSILEINSGRAASPRTSCSLSRSRKTLLRYEMHAWSRGYSCEKSGRTLVGDAVDPGFAGRVKYCLGICKICWINNLVVIGALRRESRRIWSSKRWIDFSHGWTQCSRLGAVFDVAIRNATSSWSRSSASSPTASSFFARNI
jgi:hypothetical protein